MDKKRRINEVGMDAEFNRIEREGKTVDRLHWFLIYFLIGDYIAAISFIVLRFVKKKQPISKEETKDLYSYIDRMNKITKKIRHPETIMEEDGPYLNKIKEQNLRLDEPIHGLFGHYMGNGGTALVSNTYRFVDDEEEIPVEYAEVIYEITCEIKEFLNKLREKTSKSMEQSSKVKILIADSDVFVSKILGNDLAYLSFTVLMAKTVDETLRVLREEAPRIVFLDLTATEMGGLGLLEEIKITDPRTRVIVLVNEDDKQSRQRACDLGADDYLAKPFQFENIRIKAFEKISALVQKQDQNGRARVLIVDDDANYRKDIRKIIEPRYECEIEEAHDGESAIEAIRKIKPDVITLDIRMPGVNGIDAIPQIKAISPDSSIIVISAYDNQDLERKAIERGAFEYIRKPMDVAFFKQRFEALLTSVGKIVKKY